MRWTTVRPSGGILLGFPGISAMPRTAAAQPTWALLADGATSRPQGFPAVRVSELEHVVHSRTAVEHCVDRLLDVLRHEHERLAVTPGGISWLDVHQVPARRLLRQAVRKLLALGSWPPFAQAPQLITDVGGSPFVADRETSAREYRSYTLTWPGIAYLLGAPDSEGAGRFRGDADARGASWSGGAALLFGDTGSHRPQFVAVSWSSRHVDTLVPVLEELSRRGKHCLLLDLASDSAQTFPDLGNDRVVIRRLPREVLDTPGGIPSSALDARRTGATACVGTCVVLLDRLAAVVASILGKTTGCTQPSWSAITRIESLLSDVLRGLRPQALICCNDTSPLGHLAVRVADAAGINTVHLQHGAWIRGEVAWPALHSRHVVVMGERDRDLAATWMRHPDGAIHVLGQPRFDALAAIDRTGQRHYLRTLLHHRAGQTPDRIAVFATQPVSAERLRRQLDVVVDGLTSAGPDWGLVIAPHPAQRYEVLKRLLHEIVRAVDGTPVIALADPGISARDCLGGVDALLTVSSTCGIEALLLDIPVLELALGTERTLGLAEDGAAQLCTSGPILAAALRRLAALPLPSPKAKNAVCRWDGRTAAHVADLLEIGAQAPDTERPSRPFSFGRANDQEMR